VQLEAGRAVPFDRQRLELLERDPLEARRQDPQLALGAPARQTVDHSQVHLALEQLAAQLLSEVVGESSTDQLT
jgi:hypothetical protein